MAVRLIAMHFDLTSTSEDDQRRSVGLALVLGGRHLDVGQRGDEGYVVLVDREGIEPIAPSPLAWPWAYSDRHAARD